MTMNPVLSATATDTPQREAIEAWLVTTVAGLLDIDPHTVDRHKTFDAYGFDSSALIGLTAQLGQWLNRGLDPTLLYEQQSIAEAAEHLSRTP